MRRLLIGILRVYLSPFRRPWSELGTAVTASGMSVWVGGLLYPSVLAQHIGWVMMAPAYLWVFGLWVFCVPAMLLLRY